MHLNSCPEEEAPLRNIHPENKMQDALECRISSCYTYSWVMKKWFIMGRFAQLDKI